MGDKEGYLPFPKNFETICVHHSANANVKRKDISTPIDTSVFYEPENSSGFSKYVPARSGNSTRLILENLLAALNKAKYGVCFASGIGAVAACVLGFLKPGDHLVSCDDICGSTSEFLCGIRETFHIQTSFVDFCSMENVKGAIKPETKLLWTENPTNPKLKVIDLCATAEIARKHCLLSVTDNTFLTPFLQRPLELGIDMVVHSLSKYMNGHNDVILGSVCTNKEDLYERLKYIQTNFGNIPASSDCHQVLRGLKTLPQRMKRHQQNSLKIATYLLDHPKIEEVIHPGLSTHLQHKLFKSQTSGHSGLISFYLKGSLEDSMKFINNLQIFTQGYASGGFSSVVEIPSLSSHLAVPYQLKEILKINDNFIRMSVGLEDACELINDIEQALEKVQC